MSKILEAACEDGVVTAEGQELEDVTILGEGVGQSLGVLLLDGVKQTYIPKGSPDLKDTLTQVIAALQGAIDGLSAASSGLTSLAPVADPIAGPLAIVGAVASLAAASSAIGTAKSALDTLKGNLR